MIARGPIIPVEPMKAAKGDLWETYIGNPHFVMEEKFDGGRYIVVVNKDGIKVLSRRLIDKTKQVPQMVEAIRDVVEVTPSLAKGSIFDGEVVADTGFSDTISLVNSLESRGMMKTIPYHYWIFDMIATDGYWLTHEAFEQRRDLLEGALKPIVHPNIGLTPQRPVDKAYLDELWAAGKEGVVVKDLRAGYFPGKRPPRVWMKVKKVETADGVVMGFTPGEGKYSDTIGAVIIGQVRHGRLEQVTKISGFTDELRYEIGRRKTAFEGKIVEFKYQLKTADSYRHPRFLRFRDDKRVTDCRWIDT